MKWHLYLVLTGCCISCQPKVVSFTAQPRIASTRDSVHLSWKTKGMATMSFYQTKIYVPPDSVQVLEFILTASRGSKVSAPEIRQVTDQHRFEVAVKLTGLNGDSAIYADTVGVDYQLFQVDSVSILTGNPVTVLHAGQSCVLITPGAAAACMQGLPCSGYWELRIRMTAAQLTDHHQIPGSYSLIVNISPKK